MPYFPSMGYGIGTAALKGLSYKKEYDEAQDLKRRQMKVNEDAEKRARDVADESITTSKTTRGKEEKLAESVEFADQILNPAAKVAAVDALTQADPAAGPVQVQADTAGATMPDGTNPTSSLGDGREIDEVTGLVQDELPVVGKSVKSGGQAAGEPVKVGAQMAKPSKGGYGIAVAKQESGVGDKVMADVRKGKSQTAPDEVVGIVSQADKLSADADGIEARMQEAIQTIQRRYSGDETMAKYLKANVIAKVRPQIDAMRAQSGKLRQEGQLAKFAHEAGLFSEQLLGKLETAKGAVEVDSWLDANKDTAEKLGIDLEKFKGLHKNAVGAIVNKEGYVFPREAIANIANASLPWVERFKSMEKVDKMYKVQEDLRNERYRISTSDPLRVEKWTIEQVNNFGRAYAQKDYEYSKAKEIVAGGGEFVIKTKNGEKKVAIPRQYQEGMDWLYAMSKSDNQDVVAVYEQIIRPLEMDRTLYDTAVQFLGGFRARVKPANASTADRDASAREKTSYGVTTGKLRATADDEARKQSRPLGNNS